MGDPQSPQVLTSPPPPTPQSNLPMLYYGLVIVGTATVVLILYNLILIRCTSRVTNQLSDQRMSRNPGPTMDRNFHMNNYVYSFKYKKDGEEHEGGDERECAVCLSVFEEGEQLRQVPNCKHSFHSTCIDMWLCSHFDCPLCRTSVEPIAEHSRDPEGLLPPGALL